MAIEKIKPDDMSFNSLITEINDGRIKIPDFQRTFVWERNQIVNLLDSIYHHYPIGSFLFWESDSREFQSYKDIGGIPLKDPPFGSIKYVLDGQQRITSLYATVKGAEIKVRINGKTTARKLNIFFDLDEKAFVTCGDDTDDKSKKQNYIWLLPISSGATYFDNLIAVLEEIQSNIFTEEKFIEWFHNQFGVTINSGKESLSLLKIIGLVEIEDDIVKLNYLAQELLDSKRPEILIRLLIRNISFFRQNLEFIINNGDVHFNDLYRWLNDTYNEKWFSISQCRNTVKWLWKLGYGSYTKGVFSFDPKFFYDLKNVIEEEKKIESNIVKGLEDNNLNLVSINDIIDFQTNFNLFPKLSPARQETFKKVIDRFMNYRFSVIYVRDQSIGKVCQIFERINNSGKTLSVLDLMVAKTWANNFNLRDKLNDFQKELRKENYSNINNITLLQCLSTNIQKCCQRKDILKLEREIIEENWDGSLESIRKAVDFLRQNLSVTNSRIIPFKSLLVPLSYFYFILGNKDETTSQRESIIKWFWKACISNRYSSSVESKIADDVKVMDEIVDGVEANFDYVIPIITKERIINQNYSLGSAFSKSIICLLANQQPVHLENNKIVDFNCFSNYNSAEFHHIFPKGYLEKSKNEYLDLKDSIANIAFIPSGTNKRYRDRPPRDYIGSINNPNLNEAFKTHLIEDYENSGLLENNFHEFLTKRAERILDYLKLLVGEFSAVEKGMLEDESKQIDLFEKDIRLFINDELSKSSSNYWSSNVPENLRDDVEKRITSYLSKHPLENRDNIDPIDFCNIMNYFRIIKSNWETFKEYFKSRTELEKHFLNINELRNAVRHSRDVDMVTRKLAEASLLWFNNIIQTK